jgi:hypothetical protein
MYSATKNDVKNLAAQLESLAKEVQSQITVGGDYLKVANELVKTKELFVFTLGEVYALDQVGKNKPVSVKAARVSRPYKRDSLGRFSS